MSSINYLRELSGQLGTRTIAINNVDISYSGRSIHIDSGTIDSLPGTGIVLVRSVSGTVDGERIRSMNGISRTDTMYIYLTRNIVNIPGKAFLSAVPAPCAPSISLADALESTYGTSQSIFGCGAGPSIPIYRNRRPRGILGYTGDTVCLINRKCMPLLL